MTWPPSAEWALVYVTVVLVVATIALWRATNRLVTDAGENAKRQLRAYVFLDSIIAVDPETRPPEVNLYRLLIKNSGQTPAYDVSIIALHSFGPTELKEQLVTPTGKGGATRDIIPAGGHAVVDVPRFVLSAEEIAAVKAGRGTIYLHGIIQYRDVFGKPQYSNFRHRRLPGTREFGGAEEGNDAS